MSCPHRPRRAFTPEENDAGLAWVWRRTLAADRRYGDVALERSRHVDPAILALLSLTPQVATVSPERALFLDLETSGFGAGTGNVAFVAGVARWHERGLMLEQWLLCDPDEEPALLAALCARIAASELLVSFNGKGFDMAVLRGRCVMNRLPPPAHRPHVDLLHLARRVHRHRGWRKRLATLESEVLGVTRYGDISGREVAERYAYYLRSGDEATLDEVIEHNARDLEALVGLLALYGEPGELPPEELAQVALVMRRGGDLDRAMSTADLALRRGAGALGLKASSCIARARGDVGRALGDLEALVAEVDDKAARLELGKLYEHHLRDPARALSVVVQGTSEKQVAHHRRCTRLERKRRALERALERPHTPHAEGIGARKG
jgi:uncharacterized protein YprB with RNaseH-like and TPR domain